MEFLLPVGDEHYAREMGARGMTGKVEPVRVAAELLRVAIDPGDGAADLVGHHGQISAEFLHGREIQNDEVRSSVHERLRGKSVVLREPAAPSPSVNKYVDRSVGTPRGEHVESLDGRRTIGESQRVPQPSARDFAVRRVATGTLRWIGCVDALVVGVVELLLVEVEPQARPLRPGRVLRGLAERVTRRREHGPGRAGLEKCPTREAARVSFPAHLMHPFFAFKTTPPRGVLLQSIWS